MPTQKNIQYVFLLIMWHYISMKIFLTVKKNKIYFECMLYGLLAPLYLSMSCHCLSCFISSSTILIRHKRTVCHLSTHNKYKRFSSISIEWKTKFTVFLKAIVFQNDLSKSLPSVECKYFIWSIMYTKLNLIFDSILQTKIVVNGFKKTKQKHMYMKNQFTYTRKSHGSIVHCTLYSGCTKLHFIMDAFGTLTTKNNAHVVDDKLRSIIRSF